MIIDDSTATVKPVAADVITLLEQTDQILCQPPVGISVICPSFPKKDIGFDPSTPPPVAEECNASKTDRLALLYGSLEHFGYYLSKIRRWRHLP